MKRHCMPTKTGLSGSVFSSMSVGVSHVYINSSTVFVMGRGAAWSGVAGAGGWWGLA